MGERYNCTVSDMGQMTLEIARFDSGDVGEYKVHVENAFGAAAQIIQVGLAGECLFRFIRSTISFLFYRFVGSPPCQLLLGTLFLFLLSGPVLKLTFFAKRLSL